MIVNPDLVQAARLTTRVEDRGGALLQVDGYSGMFVAESGNSLIQALHFFSEGDRRFALGPLLKAAGRLKIDSNAVFSYLTKPISSPSD